jgi:hypothetical protein
MRSLLVVILALRGFLFDFDLWTTGFVAHDDVSRIYLLAGFSIKLPLFDPVPGLLVDQMKSDFLAVRDRRKQLDRTRY